MLQVVLLLRFRLKPYSAARWKIDDHEIIAFGAGGGHLSRWVSPGRLLGEQTRVSARAST